MADNTSNEIFDNPINPTLENLQDKIISTKESEAVTANQKTENMEVHKHPPDDGTHKKKCAEYLLDC